MTRLHKPDNDDFCAPRVKTYELPELLELYIKAAVPYFRKLIEYQVGYISTIYIDTHAFLKSGFVCAILLLQIEAHIQNLKDDIVIPEQAGPQAVLSLLVHFLQEIMDCKYLRQDKILLKDFINALNTDESVGNCHMHKENMYAMDIEFILTIPW